MKKLLLGVIAFALIITSCNKYEDDFKDLNAKIDALKTQVAGVATLAAGITDLQGKLATLTAAVAALPNPTASITTLTNNLATLTTNVTAIQTKLNTLATDVAAGKVTSDAAAVKVAELQAALALTQLDIVKILANTSMYVGDVSITTDAEVDFWTLKIAQLGMINGRLEVNTTDISKIAAMNLILDNVKAVIGGSFVESKVDLTTSPGKTIDLSNLTSVVGDFDAYGSGSELQSSLNISSLSVVTGEFIMDFDGPYALPALTKVGGNMYLINHAADTDLGLLGTTTVNFPLVTVDEWLNNGTVSFPIATLVNVAGDMTTFGAAKATLVVLRGNYSGGLVFNAAIATSVSIAAASAVGPVTINAAKATSVSLPKLTTIGAGNAFGITTSAVTVVALPLLATSGALTIDMGSANNGSVDLSLFASDVAVTVKGPEILSLPKYVAGTGLLTSTTAKTVTLAKHGGTPAPALVKVETLTMSALNTGAFNIGAYTTLKYAIITGKSDMTNETTVAGVTTTAANATLLELTLAGPMVTVNVNDQTKLTKLATSGIINSLTVNSCDALATVSFLHTHFIGGALGTGSVLVVTGNPKLTELTTSTNFMKTLTVTGNALLTAMYFNSYVDILYPGSSVGITISDNKISGSYTAPVSVTPTTPFVEAIVKSKDLLTLKAYTAKLAVAVSAGTITVPTFFLDVDDINATTSGLQPLSGVMTDTYTAVSRPTVVDATGGINTFLEMALVVAK